MSGTPKVNEEDTLGKAYDARLMRRLLRYLRPYRGRVALAVVLLFAGAIVELTGPWLTKIAIDTAIPEGDASLLTTLAIVYIAVLTLAFVMEYLQKVLTTWIGQRVMYDLRREIFAHFQRLGLRFFDRNPVGRLMTRVVNDVEVLNELFSSGVVAIFGDIFTLAFIIAAMFLLDWRLALVALAVMPLVLFVAFFFRGRIREAFRDIRVRLARINAFLQERLGGIGVVQLFGREKQSAARFRRINRDHLDAHLRSITYYALFFPVIEVLTSVALALLLVYGGFRILDDAMTIGVLAAFIQYSRRFFRPIQDLSEKYNMLQGAMAASERIFSLLDTEPEILEPSDPVPLPAPGRGEIEFRNVWFAYQDRPVEDAEDRAVGAGGSAPNTVAPGANHTPTRTEPDWVLRDVSFRIRPGETVAVVGHTGAGKTSLINLLMRFYEPQRGQILFDGVPIDRVPTAALRARIGLVLQDVFLFSRDIAHNIHLGRDDISDARVRAAAARVGADRFIQHTRKGYDSPLGERGASLSVGQRQLISFARALAFDPLVLVLDEATSAVDSELEAQIQDALATLMAGRTSLVVAHRLSTVQNADRILVLHRGELREQGTHDELLALGGLYARLHELQFAPPSTRRSASGSPAASGRE